MNSIQNQHHQLHPIQAIKEERRFNRELCMCLSLLTIEGFRGFLIILREHKYESIAMRLDPEEDFNSFDQIDAFSGSFKISLCHLYVYINLFYFYSF